MTKPITDTLGELEGGRYLIDTSKELDKVVKGVLETSKVGKLKLELEIRPNGRGSVAIDASYTSKVPEETRPTSTFFTDQNATLLRRDPNQPDLPLRSVKPEDDAAATPIRAVNE